MSYEGFHVMGPDLLILGLGNPGKEYSRTRHNMGFMVADEVARRSNASFKRRPKYLHASAESAGRKFLVVKPRTYMNLSGAALLSLLSGLKIEQGKVVVVHDDLDLPFGTLRLKVGGGHGGHKGVQSLIEAAGPDFIRLRIGIGHPGIREDVTEYVLSGFSEQEKELLPGLISKASDVIELISDKGIMAAMNQVNQKERMSAN
ncbi:MAG: aminoacyl-tRNA hydrolase [Deltaproteobacteria bacterium]|nr:aminoacyl-tRNA hydrolase [Deltaproteobacteria bacterium]